MNTEGNSEPWVRKRLWEEGSPTPGIKGGLEVGDAGWVRMVLAVDGHLKPLPLGVKKQKVWDTASP